MTWAMAVLDEAPGHFKISEMTGKKRLLDASDKYALSDTFSDSSR